MPGAFGTMTTLDTLREITAQNVLEFGEDRILEAVRRELDIQNQIADEITAAFAEDTTDNAVRGYGAPQHMEMIDLDEQGTPTVQKVVPSGQNIGFPLRNAGAALQWTRSAFEMMTPAELAEQVDAATLADTNRILRDIKRALYIATNYSFTDKWEKGLLLPVKRLVNADGDNIPVGPDGTVFNGATHTHYLATASLVAGDVVALYSTVIEHYNTGSIRIYINKAQEAAIRAMTSNFVALPPPNIQQASTITYGLGGTLDTLNPNNRLIGYFDGNEVWVKPWCIAGYILAINPGVRRPLVRRKPKLGTGNFEMVYQDDAHALRAEAFRRRIGFGVRERTNGAVLYTGGGTYVSPTIA